MTPLTQLTRSRLAKIYPRKYKVFVSDFWWAENFDKARITISSPSQGCCITISKDTDKNLKWKWFMTDEGRNIINTIRSRKKENRSKMIDLNFLEIVEFHYYSDQQQDDQILNELMTQCRI